MIIDKVINKLISFNNILLVTHENPDGDTLSSASVMYQVLKKLGKNPVIVCKDPVPQPFLFLQNINRINSDILFGDFDIIILIDCGDLKRTGFAERLKEFARNKKILINIDHHPKNDLHKLTQLNLVDYNASSTAEIIYEIINKIEISIDSVLATTLLTGLYTDTGGFKHSNTTPKTLEIAAELLRRGAKIKLITKNVSLNKSVAAMKLWGIALSRLYYHNELKISSSMLTQKDIRDCQAQAEDISGVVNLINTIPDSNAAILFYETQDGKIRASLRTEKENIDVSRLAYYFGGGGHKKASGFTIDGKIKLNKNGFKIEIN